MENRIQGLEARLQSLTAAMENETAYRGAAVTKPYRLQEMSRALHDVLGGAPGS